MIDQDALDAAVRLYLPWARGEGVLTEDSIATALIRTAYRRFAAKTAHAEEQATRG